MAGTVSSPPVCHIAEVSSRCACGAAFPGKSGCAPCLILTDSILLDVWWCDKVLYSCLEVAGLWCVSGGGWWRGRAGADTSLRLLAVSCCASVQGHGRAQMKRSQSTIYAVMLHLMHGAHQASRICLFSGCAVCSAVWHCSVSDTVLDCYRLNKLGIKLWVAFESCLVFWKT